ncbi:hypothetical protein DSL72_000246 [Monilinia vaccinii-corymbosi]|uniref:Uncharacterized protein n=1 Tax=Monilinia vaccinii-corymbosi TaxID=61207 RepID=A0A8A3P8B7_9HELO|nr:hypothetical protein DSL72_000246 [Monilinia vaccinii-corymbosi]
MDERTHLRRSRSQAHFQRRRPDDIYIRNPQACAFAYSSVDEPASPRNFFLENLPARWESLEDPISPGVTMLLSPASWFDEDGADLEVMEFFQTATYSGPRTFAQNPTAGPGPLNANRKKSTSKMGLSSPKTPKAWPSIVEPDISTLPSREAAERSILKARLKLTGQVTSSETSLDFEHGQHSQKENPLEAYLVASRPMRGRKAIKLPPLDRNQRKICPEHEYFQSLPIDDRRLVEPKTSLSPNRPHMRLPTDGKKGLRSTCSQKIMPVPASAVMHRTVSRTPSPAFDFDDSEITDIESDAECDERGKERLSRCETLSSQDPHSPMFDRPPKPFERDWKFRLQDDCAMGVLGTLEPSSTFHSTSQAPRESATYRKDCTKATCTTRPRHVSAESCVRSPTSPILVAPARRKSPPRIAPIHQDQMRESGAPFEPESRTPRTVVSHWLSSISSHAGRRESPRQPPREQQVSWRKSRSWGRKTKAYQREGWI